MTTKKSGTQELHEYLDRSVDRILEDGTRAEARTLQAMAEAARALNPGASAALVDWDGPEVARLRAFGIVHGVLVRDLPADLQAHLLTRLRGGRTDGPAAVRDGAGPLEPRGSGGMVRNRRHRAASSSAMARGR
jgi:hypothetical protein